MNQRGVLSGRALAGTNIRGTCPHPDENPRSQAAVPTACSEPADILTNDRETGRRRPDQN
jgi:hypothetical protein